MKSLYSKINEKLKITQNTKGYTNAEGNAALVQIDPKKSVYIFNEDIYKVLIIETDDIGEYLNATMNIDDEYYNEITVLEPGETCDTPNGFWVRIS